jgi:protein O-mannosyl-transferase
MNAVIRLSWLLVPVVGLIVFLPVVEFGYVWDDGQILVASAMYQGHEAAFESAFEPFLSGNYFRPLPLLALSIEQTIAAGDPALSHLVSLLIHCMNAGLVLAFARYLLARAWGNNRVAAVSAVAGLLFVLHPAAIEAVAWLSCRFELMMTSFVLMAYIADQALRAAPLRAMAVGALFLAAAFCKEMAVGFALTLPLLHAISMPQPVTVTSMIRKHGWTYLAVIVAGSVYLAVRVSAMRGIGLSLQEPFVLGSLTHLIVVLKTLGQYAMLSFWPFTELQILHVLSVPYSSVDAELLVCIASVLLVAAAAIYFVRRRQAASVLPLCMVLSLFPVLNFIPIPMAGSFAAERLLYFPLVFWSLWVPAAFAGARIRLQSGRMKPILASLVLIYWFALCVISIRLTLPFWRDDLSLWTWAHRQTPNSELAATNLTAAYVASGQAGEAVEFTLRLLRERPGVVTPDQFRIFVYALALSGYSIDSALDLMRARVEQQYPGKVKGIHPAGVKNSLGWLYLHAGDVHEAEKWFLEAIDADRHYTLANYGLSVVYAILGNAALESAYRAIWTAQAHPRGQGSLTQGYDSLVKNYSEKARRFVERDKASPAAGELSEQDSSN